MFYNLLVDQVIYSVPGAAGFHGSPPRRWRHSPLYELLNVAGRRPGRSGNQNAGGFASNDIMGILAAPPPKLPPPGIRG